MKYIRTKDGKILENNWCSVYDAPASLYNNIEKQANTIEELCDVLVNIAYDGHGKPHWEIRCWYDRTWKKDFKKDSDWSVYGAIWTEKGLIYVAKMNEEGVLCLI